jgi:gas vesicle protein
MIDNDLLTLIRREFKELYYKDDVVTLTPQHLISQFDWSSIYYDYILYEEEQHYNRLINEAKLIPLDILKEKYAKMVIVEDKEDEKEEYKRLKQEDNEIKKSIDEWNERNDREEREYYKNNYEDDDDEYDEDDDDEYDEDDD